MEEDEDSWNGRWVYRAEETVPWNDSSQAGVFPGDKNRTLICSIKPRNRSKGRSTPVVKEFDEDFEFELVRFGDYCAAMSSLTVSLLCMS